MRENLRSSNNHNEWFKVKDTLHFWAFNDFMAFRDVHNQLVGEESSLVDLLKESKDLNSSKKISKFVEKYWFSMIGEDFIKYESWDFYSWFGLDGDAPSLWYYKKGVSNFEINPSSVENSLFNSDNVYSPSEMFEGQWGKEMINKYTSFCNEMLGKVKSMKNELLENSKKRWLKWLFDRL